MAAADHDGGTGTSRDFVHVSDIVRANLACLDTPEIGYGVYNVGSGDPLSILDLAHLLACEMGSDIEPVVTGKFRVGDVRHSYADVSKIGLELGWTRA